MDTLHEKLSESPYTTCWLCLGPVGAFVILFFF